jgi:hypothetical protein
MILCEQGHHDGGRIQICVEHYHTCGEHARNYGGHALRTVSIMAICGDNVHDYGACES